MKDVNDFSVVQAAFPLSFGGSTFIAAGTDLRRIDSNGTLQLSDDSFVKGDYSEDDAPSHPAGGVFIPGDLTPSGRDIALLRIRRGSYKDEVAALTMGAEGQPELRWSDTEEYGNSTFLELDAGTKVGSP